VFDFYIFYHAAFHRAEIGFLVHQIPISPGISGRSQPALPALIYLIPQFLPPLFFSLI
jgi:hypothetical protein